MSKYVIDDDFLYKYMKNVENIMLDSLPKEGELFHEFSKEFEIKMNRLIRRERRSPFMKSFINYGKKVAIIFLIFMSIGLVTTMSVEAYRVRFFEVVIEVWEEFTSIIFKNKENIINDKLLPAVPERIPKGFFILEQNTNDHIFSVIYINADNKEIFYEQKILSHGEVLLDTENIEVETMEICDQPIVLRTNKGVNQIYWSDDSYTYTLISSIDIEEIIEMAKSILENNKKNLK